MSQPPIKTRSGLREFLLPTTLYGRLVRVMWLLVTFLAIGQFFISNSLFRRASDRLDQIYFSGMAESLANELRQPMIDGIDSAELQFRLLTLMELNPAAEVYVLDNKGRILYASVPRPVLQFRGSDLQIDLQPIKKFLAVRPDKRFPIYGTNPNGDAEPKVFSVARLTAGDFDGYVYVILEGDKYLKAIGGFLDYYAIFGGLVGYLLLAAFTAALGTFIFQYVARRFQVMSRGIQYMAQGNWHHRIDLNGDDELGQLAQSVNYMAATTEASLQALEGKDALRRELVSHIAHDLKGPLTAAQGFLDSASDEYEQYSEKERRNTLVKARQSLSGLSRLIQDLLELSKLEVQAVTPEWQSFDVTELLSEELLPRLEQLAAHHRVSIELSCPEEPVYVRADMQMIERVLGNLLENAVKYNEEGGRVIASVQCAGNRAIISVEDSGPGLSPDEQEQIFQSFYRSSKARRKGEGSGLGLAIVRAMIEAHGEQITVRSAPGEGAEFCFSLSIDEEG